MSVSSTITPTITDRFFVGQRFTVKINGTQKEVEVFGVSPRGGYITVDEDGNMYQSKVHITLELEEALSPIPVYERTSA